MWSQTDARMKSRAEERRLPVQRRRRRVLPGLLGLLALCDQYRARVGARGSVSRILRGALRSQGAGCTGSSISPLTWQIL